MTQFFLDRLRCFERHYGGHNNDAYITARLRCRRLIAYLVARLAR
jgi:hypothetical protein